MLTAIISSLIIGNVIAWFSGAAPIDFPKVPYTEPQQQQLTYLQQALKETPDDIDVLLELGQLYSHHNQLDKADDVLSEALELAPENGLAQAAYYSNDGKLAGAMFDPGMGIYKLVRLRSAMSAVNDATENHPDDIQIRLIRLMTFAFVGEISGYSEKVFEDEAWFKQQFSTDPSTPDAIKQLVYLALAHAYQPQNSEQSGRYLAQAQQIGPCPNTLANVCETLPTATLAAESE